MACEGAVSNVCTGLVTGEACADIKPIVIGLPDFEGLTISVNGDGTEITVSWNTDISYPTHLVRGHIREVMAVGYPEDGFQLEARNTGALTFTMLTPETEYWVWIRLEDETQAAGWFLLKQTTTPGEVTPLEFVIHQGEVILHKGDVVIY